MVNAPAPLPTGPASVGTLIETSFRVWTQTLGACFALSLAPSLVGLLPAVLMPSDPADPQALLEWMQRPSVWLLYLLVIVVSLLCMGALCYRMGMLGRGSDPGLNAAIARGIERLPAVLGAWLLYLLLLMLSLLPWFAALGWVAASGGGAAAIGLFVLASLILLLPAAWISLAAGFFLYAATLERRGPLDSLRRSLQLVRGQWWRSSVVLGTVLLIYLCGVGFAAVLAGVVAGGATVAMQGSEALQDTGWLLGLQLLLAPIGAVGQQLFYAGGLAMFNDLVLRQAPLPAD